MSFIDWLVLALTILTLVEAVREARRKQWSAFAMSAVVFLLLVFWFRHLWIYIWNFIAGGP